MARRGKEEYSPQFGYTTKIYSYTLQESSEAQGDIYVIIELTSSAIPMVFGETHFVEGTSDTHNVAYQEDSSIIIPVSYDGNKTITADASNANANADLIRLKIIYIVFDDQEEEPSSDSSAHKVLYARDKTRQNFTPYDWSGQGASDVQALISMIYPVGSIYISTIGTHPAEMWGFGQWTRIHDTFLWAGGNDVGLGQGATTAVAGKKEATLPSHFHTTPSYPLSWSGSHSHTPNYSSTSKYKHKNYGGFLSWLPDQTLSTEVAAKTHSYLQNGEWNCGSATKTGSVLPYFAFGTKTAYSGKNPKDYVDFVWWHNTASANVSVSMNTGNRNTDSKGVSDTSTANMPPYLPVYVWKRIS